MIHKKQDFCQRAFDDIAAVLVGCRTLPYRVGDICLCFCEPAEDLNLIPMLGKEKVDEALVIARHREHMGAAFEKFLCHGLASERAQVDADLREGRHGVLACCVAPGRVHACGNDPDVFSLLEKIPHESLGHGTSAGIAGADKKDGFHDGPLTERSLGD